MEDNYDLRAAIKNNGSVVSFDDISQILASVNGDNDGPDWHWLVELKDGRHYYLTGGCDYTGWDCQSNLITIPVPNIKDLSLVVPEVDNKNRPIREIFEKREFA